ncbi:MAG: indolepyruvate oxidoreductase subunit beta [Eubacteriales bacterium]
MTRNIMIVGVGGQGTLLTSRVLGNTVINQGHDVKVSEVHGMSQRGGSVTTYVKYGKKVYSPVIEKGEADIIIAFELLEAYRALPYLREGGKMIVNTQQMNPMPVIIGVAEYPENILGKLQEKINVVAVNAIPLATEAGNMKAANVVMIGVLAKSTDIPREQWEESIHQTVPAKLLEVNLKAFALGYEM